MKLLFVNRFLLVLVAIILFKPATVKAYSVLTHEAVIDASWEKSIRPLLKQKYPLATDSELRVAHSYAYGGCMMPDMGYFPFGSEYFTNLAHYVRTGDFVEALFSESRNLNDYAFALGALCHYMADKYGHSLATNHVVPLVYPDLKRKYGDTVTYEENHTDHSRVEISFDVLQVARGNYVTQEYHDFIGFNVAKPLLERAFLKTYGEDINAVFSDFDLAVSTFRWSVRSLLPTVTRSAWALKRNEIKQMNPSINSHKFHYKMRRRDYYLEFGKKRQKPTFRERMIAFLIAIIPKVGPFKALRFKDPGTAGEKLFIASFDTVLVKYAVALNNLKTGKISLPDIDYDTGNRTEFGEYDLTDETYGDMLYRLNQNKFFDLTAPLKKNIISFYNNADTIHFAQVNPVEWKKTYAALQQLKQAPAVKTDSLKTAKGANYKTEQ
jgi:hypothetical protein